jgi:putative ABC transport system permease protein
VPLEVVSTFCGWLSSNLEMDSLLRDFRHAVRNLARTPGFALVTILTLALGIGANTAIFSVVNAVILRPLGYPHPEQLVYISSQFPAMGFDQFWISPPEFLEFQERTHAFAVIGAFATGQANLTAPDRPRRVNAGQASADLFRTLGVNAQYGRTFDAAETRPNGPRVTILSNELWRSAFGGSASILNSEIEINGVRRTVIGIMPPGFDVADGRIELWNPLVLDPANRTGNRGSHYLYLIGRLAPGATLASANGELDSLLAGWRSSLGASVNAANAGMVHAPDPKDHRLRLDALQTQIVGSARTAVFVLQGAVVFVLLIACANLANLLLARAESRHKEFAVRAALGAGRARLLRQFMVEGCVLSCTGAALGLAVAIAGVRALIAAYPDSLPRSAEVTLDLGVLAFTLLVGLATGAIFGLAPLLHLGADATSLALKEGGTRATAGAGRNRVRRALVAAEVALAVALVIGAGLLLRTVMNLSNVDSGFNRSRLVTFAVTLPNAKYARPEQVRGFYTRLLDDLRSIGGVQSVAAMSGLPPLRQVNANDTDIENYTPPPKGPFANVDYYNLVTAGYVETMGIPVLEGRAFLPTDALGTTVMINETMARTFYKGTSAIGRRVRPSAPPSFKVPWFTIVGVLKDVKQGGVDKKTGTELYLNFDQITTVNSGYGVGTMNIVMRTSQPPDTMASSIRAIVGGLDSTLPIVKLRSVDEVFDESIGRPRLLAQLLGIFAALALLLAAIGSYGVLSYMVTERRREIGIRMALGADRASVLRMVLGQGLRLTLFGILAGLSAAFALNRLIASLLFGVKPTDPATIGGVVLLITTVALIACYLPARGATRVDPMIVLREE